MTGYGDLGIEERGGGREQERGQMERGGAVEVGWWLVGGGWLEWWLMIDALFSLI